MSKLTIVLLVILVVLIIATVVLYFLGKKMEKRQAEQQEQILNTFQNKDQFIVVGTRPLDGTVTSEALDAVLSQKWGEHYISLASVTAQPSATYEAQQAMAEAILQKLQDLGYISKAQ